MAWTEQDYQEIVARLMAESIGVNEVPDAGSTDDISSLPAYQPANGTEVPTVVKASLELLVAPALEAADKANEAADKAESNATAAQTAANTANEKAELAAQAASDANAAKEGAEVATQSANNAASNANEKAVLADTAAANANDTAEHPTYIGTDHYVYKWNKTAQAYDKTDIYTKGDAFSIKKVYASVANMEADKSNPDITEGDFVLVNTGDVEDPDNAKLYVKADGDFEFLVDMSGAIGFTGKTPQFSMGTVTTLEAGASATATVSSDGTDEGGNPKYKLNFAIPRGNPGAPFKPVGQYDTLELLKQAIPDGSDVDGMIAVGTEAPYDYYAWLNGEWVGQGKIDGIGEAPSDGNTYGRKNEGWVEVPEHLNLTSEDLNDINGAGFATQKSAAGYTTPENNYPINENGALIFANANYAHSNQIYGSYLTNRWFARGGGNQQGIRTDWKEFVFTGDVLTKTNTSPFTPTGDYQPAPKKYVDDKFWHAGNDGSGSGLDADLLDGKHLYQGQWDSICYIGRDGVLEIGKHIDFHEEQGMSSDFSCRIMTQGDYQNILFLPTSSGTLATKEYVYGKTINVSNGTVLVTNANLKGVDAESKVNSIFGSLGNFRNIVKDVISNHTRYFFHSYNSENNCLELSSIYSYYNSAAANQYQLQFFVNYYTNRATAKCMAFSITDNTDDAVAIIQDIVSSDNLTTITKKTATEYEAIGSKDANTAYCVTD